VRRAEADSGARTDLPTSREREEIRRLRQKNFELRRANEILESAVADLTYPRSWEGTRPALSTPPARASGRS
jgi:transposase